MNFLLPNGVRQNNVVKNMKLSRCIFSNQACAVNKCSNLRILLWFSCVCLILFIVSGCGKEEEVSPIEIADETKIEEEIFELTGCRPVDAETIDAFQVFQDKAGSKYLYGSKKKNDKSCFWFSKYDSDGKSIWDVVHEDAEWSSWGYKPVELLNGNIVIGNEVGNSYSQLYNRSLAVFKADGNAKFLDLRDGFFYSNVLTYEDFFFTTINIETLLANPSARDCNYQISNNGDIIRYFPDDIDWLLPQENYIWLNDSTFVSIEQSEIARYNITKEAEEWHVDVKLPTHKSCDMSIELDGMALIASYFLVYEDLQQDTIVYQLYPSTGEPFVELEDFYFPETEISVARGNNINLQPVFVPNDAIRPIEWSSSNEAIATVDDNGVVTALSLGTCTIKAFLPDEGVGAECHIIVKEPTIEDLIDIRLGGSVISINGFITGNITLNFHNNSNRKIIVNDFKVYDSSTERIVLEQSDDVIVESGMYITQELIIRNVYNPRFTWNYTCEGKSYQLSKTYAELSDKN